MRLLKGQYHEGFETADAALGKARSTDLYYGIP